MGRSEGLRPSSGEPQKPNSKLFPVGDTAISQTLSLITSDNSRDHVTTTESYKVKQNNEHLASLFENYFGYYQSKTRRVGTWEYQSFMNGAMLVHNVLRNQAEDKIPTLIVDEEQDDINHLWRSELTRISDFARDNDISEENLEVIAQLQFKQLAKDTESDHALGEALLNHADIYPGGNSFLVGAMFAYFPIKTKYLENEQEKKEREKRKIKLEAEKIAKEADRDEIAGWITDPELAAFEGFAHEVWNAQMGTGNQPESELDPTITIDTSDIGVNFTDELARLEAFLDQQRGQQG